MFTLRKKRQHDLLKFIVYVILGFCLIFYQNFYPSSANKIILKSYSFITPITKITHIPSNFVKQWLYDLSFYFNAVDENKLLKEENDKLRQFYKKSLVLSSENRDLRYLMNMAEYIEQETVLVDVYLDSSNLYANSFITNLGSADGIKPGFAAVTAEGLVGRVLEVDDYKSRILLINDFNASIPVRILESGVQGMVKGSNDSNNLALITKEIGDVVKEGDHIVSSSVQGLFDDGIPVGVVSKINSNKIKVIPYANLNRVNKVLIVKRNN